MKSIIPWIVLISFLILAGALVDCAWTVFMAALISFVIFGFVWIWQESKSAPYIQK